MGSVSYSADVKAPIDVLWPAYINVDEITHLIAPEIIEWSRIVEGSGGQGSIREVKFGKGLAEIPIARERIDRIDNEKHIFEYSVIGGDTLQHFTSFKASMEFAAASSDPQATIVNYTAWYEPKDAPSPATAHEMFFKLFFKRLEEYLQKQELTKSGTNASGSNPSKYAELNGTCGCKHSTVEASV